MKRDPVPPSLARLLLDRFRWFEAALLSRLAEAGYPGLGMAHSAVFAVLDRDGTRPAEIVRRLGVTRQSAHETIHELIGMGLLELVPDDADRRASVARLTATGRDHVKVAREIFQDLEREVRDRIGSDVLLLQHVRAVASSVNHEVLRVHGCSDRCAAG